VCSQLTLDDETANKCHGDGRTSAVKCVLRGVGNGQLYPVWTSAFCTPSATRYETADHERGVATGRTSTSLSHDGVHGINADIVSVKGKEAYHFSI